MSIRSTPKEVERLRQLVRHMSRDSLIYKMLKQELTARGYWKNKKRGKPRINVLPY